MGNAALEIVVISMSVNNKNWNAPLIKTPNNFYTK